MKNPLFPAARNWLTLGALFLAVAAPAQDMVRLEAQPGSKLRFDGTSTIHDWFVEGNLIGGFVELDAKFPLDPAVKPEPGKVKANAQAVVAVRSLKSDNKKPMDLVMYEHLGAAAFPKIEYTLKELTCKGVTSKGEPAFDAVGELVVHGVTNKLSMPLCLDRQAKDKARFYTPLSVTLKMSDYKVDPPNPNIAGVGIKTGDEVKLNFEWILAAPVK